MPVTQRLMLPGTWEISLTADAPKDLRNLLALLGHVLILDGDVDARQLNDAGMKATSRYTGILRKRRTAFTLGGPGLLAWLGDEQGKGNLYETNVTLTNGTFAQWVAALLPTSLSAGSITAVAGTLTKTFNVYSDSLSPRGAMDWIMLYFGGEYRLNPNGTFDAGANTALFRMTPQAIVQRTAGGRDMAVVGIPATGLDFEQDADDWSSRVLLLGASSGTAQGNAPSNPYKDFLGNAAVIKRFVSDPNTPNVGAVLIQMAGNLATKWSALHNQITLTTDLYDLPRDVAVGDNLWVYDPQRGLIDITQQVHYRGQILCPMTVRVLATTWPVQRGLGVYYRDRGGVYTDLTPYVAWEPPGTTHEIGAAARKF